MADNDWTSLVKQNLPVVLNYGLLLLKSSNPQLISF
jgi:hypothetical protein